MSSLLHAEELWWKNTIMYCLDVETYMDGNGDGVGDFVGLTRRLDHLASLGVTCIWLMPFYPSSGDDGYAITDFYNVDPRYGSLGDFVTFRRAAGDRGIRVIIDLVVNHTSDEHPWFVEARGSRDGPRRDWYVWSDEPIEAANAEVFPGEQNGNWAFDERTGQYYFHRFYEFQPDLNLAKREVRMEILQTMGFWLELGVDGFRLDALPFLIETHGVEGPAREEHHEWLKEMHAFVDHRRGDAVLLGEANLEPVRLSDYFADGDEVQLVFNYSQNAALMSALADESAKPLCQHLTALPTISLSCGWLNFVRVHDELNLERLDPDQRERVFERFAPDPEHRIYGRGLRRRLAPMLRDRRRLELAYSLTFALPGMPLLYYGDEIGMGDNLELEGRLAARTPMQWEAEPSGGFSTAPPDRLVRPLASEPGFEPGTVNVGQQRHDSESLLQWMRELVDVRRRHPTIGLGAPDFFETGHDDVLGHYCRYGPDVVAAVHNLSGEPRRVDVRGIPAERPLSVVFTSDGGYVKIDDTVELDPYGYRWLRGNSTDPAHPPEIGHTMP